jgi:hypothetical protein
MEDVNHSWAVWYNKIKDAYTLQTAGLLFLARTRK